MKAIRHRAAGRLALAFSLLCAGTLAACNNGGGGGGSVDETEFVEHWNHIAVDSSGLDHQPTDANHTFGEQVGPCRAARAMAIVHIAVFEAVNAIKGGYQSYVGLPSAAPGTDLRAAIGQASHDTLAALFPSQAQSGLFAADLTTEMSKISNGTAKTNGVALGHAAAQAVLAMRNLDGSELPEPRYGTDYVASDQPGKWRQDPISMHPLALGGDWDQVTPFVLTSADQFRAPVPPDLTSAAYQLAYEEAKVLGGDGITTPTARTAEATEIGTYWAYDGTPSLCAPPRLYNQIAMQIAKERHTGVVEMARLLALVNVAMADAGIACWDSKYFYEFWRPVAGIRESDPGTGPTGLGDGNAGTVGDANYRPLGAPASNGTGPNFTPPFPAYPSGHATFGGALFQTLRRFYGTDDIEFTFVSDEFNGVTQDNAGNVRPLIPRTFSSLSEAEEENGQSRIYLGIHWSFDKSEGIAMGREVGNWVFDHAFLPVP